MTSFALIGYAVVVTLLAVVGWGFIAMTWLETRRTDRQLEHLTWLYNMPERRPRTGSR